MSVSRFLPFPLHTPPYPSHQRRHTLRSKGPAPRQALWNKTEEKGRIKKDREKREYANPRDREPSLPYAHEVVESIRSLHTVAGIPDETENENHKSAEDKQVRRKKVWLQDAKAKGKPGAVLGASILVIALTSALPCLAPRVRTDMILRSCRVSPWRITNQHKTAVQAPKAFISSSSAAGSGMSQ
ncbi:hypothetical protein LZ32DRAFT_94734 [Colletotrichum eremochloae]|nr:hypothetical protein LZ32DRAFT_94734 [Colletotrichum eremochloae]